jgi:carboxylesterase
VADGYALLKARCEQVVVVGLSLGGLLSLLLATQVKVAGVGVLASPLHFDNRLIPLSRYLRVVMPTAASSDRTADPLFARVQKIQRERGEPEYGRVAHYRMSTAALAQLVQLQVIVLRHLPAIIVPTLAIYSEADKTAPVANLDRLASSLISVPRLERHILSKSDHVLTQDIEHETVADLCGSFIKRCVGHHD